jgi:hypothetical protein
MPTSPITIPSKDIQTKAFDVTRTMTAGTDRAFQLPKGARILAFILTGVASNAGTTATLSVGTTSGTPVEYVNAVSVLAAGVGDGVQVLKGVAGAVGQPKLSADTMVYVKYGETGAASSAGSWTLWVVYVTGSQMAGVW